MRYGVLYVRSHGNAERGRGAGRKSWLLKNVIITLATVDPPTPAPTLYIVYDIQ